jgi:hypothetical protein
MISPALGSGINETLIWANELGAIASTEAITSPTINLDLNVICSPFKVAERTQNKIPTIGTAPRWQRDSLSLEIFIKCATGEFSGGENRYGAHATSPFD